MDITFRVPGDCVPWARAGGRGTQHFTPPKQRHYAAVVRDVAAKAMAGAPPLEGPCELLLRFTYLWPKSVSARRRADPAAALKASKPDADNLSKLVKDALKGIAYRDDAQICDLHVWKRFGDLPGVICTLRPIGFIAGAAR